MDSSEERSVIRERSLEDHHLSECDLFDRHRPSRFRSNHQHRVDSRSEPIAEDIYFAEGDPTGEIPEWLDLLTELERWVILRRFGFWRFSTMTQAEIAMELGITQQAVAKAEVAAKARLAEHLGDPQQLNAVI